MAKRERADKRAQIVRLLRQGATVRDICRLVGCSPKTVVKIRHELGLYGHRVDKALQEKRLRWRLRCLEDELLRLRNENTRLRRRLLLCYFCLCAVGCIVAFLSLSIFFTP